MLFTGAERPTSVSVMASPSSYMHTPSFPPSLSSSMCTSPSFSQPLLTSPLIMHTPLSSQSEPPASPMHTPSSIPLSVSQSLSSTTSSLSLSTVPSSPSSLHTHSSSVVSLSAPSCTALTLGHEITEAVERLGFKLEDSPLLSECQTQVTLSVDAGASPPCIIGKSQGRSKSWLLNYSVLSFLMNGQLFAEYRRIANMLGLPPCSDTHWQNITGWLSEHVTKLAEWCCEQVRESVRARGDQEAWVASYDGYYLTRGHHSNNSSATLHDYSTGNIAWFKHRTKRGVGHNWEGTSGGAEADMYDEILSEAKKAGFNIVEMVTDKDSSMNAIYCRHFPEGTITYCSNHSAKTMHKDLQKVKQLKCTVSKLIVIVK